MKEDDQPAPRHGQSRQGEDPQQEQGPGKRERFPNEELWVEDEGDDDDTI